jgi:hypothetical protein
MQIAGARLFLCHRYLDERIVANEQPTLFSDDQYLDFTSRQPTHSSSFVSS